MTRRGKGDVIYSAVFLGIGLALLVWFIFHYDFTAIGSIIAKANVLWAAGGVVCHLLAMLIKAVKWHSLVLALQREARLRDTLLIFFAASMIGTATPLRSGDSVAAFLMKRHMKLDVGRGLSVVFVDRFWELVFLLLFVLLSTLYLAMSVAISSTFMRVLLLALVFVSALVVGLVILVLLRRRLIAGTVNVLETHSQKQGLLRRALLLIARELGSFSESVGRFLKWDFIRLQAPLTLLTWLFEFAFYFFVVGSIVRVPFEIVASAQAITNAVSLVAAIPFGLGSGQIPFTYIISLAGFPATEAAAASILLLAIFAGSALVTGSFSILMSRAKQEPF